MQPFYVTPRVLKWLFFSDWNHMNCSENRCLVYELQPQLSTLPSLEEDCQNKLGALRKWPFSRAKHNKSVTFGVLGQLRVQELRLALDDTSVGLLRVTALQRQTVHISCTQTKAAPGLERPFDMA